MNTPITVTHDNGNHVCLSDGSVYVRMDRTYFDPKGNVVPGVGALVMALVQA